VEVLLGFTCANLPAVRPLWTKWFGLGGSTAASYPYPPGKSGASAGGPRSGLAPMGRSKNSRMTLGSKDGGMTGFTTAHGNGSDEIELTGTQEAKRAGSDLEAGIRVKTDIEARWEAASPSPDAAHHGKMRSEEFDGGFAPSPRAI
jgi:hypothetical protein